MSKFFSPKPKHPPQIDVEDRPPKPFYPGDIVEMMHEGFCSIQKGEHCRVDKVSWGNTTNEWCIMVYSLSTGVGQGYRSSRFKLVKKGNRPMNTTFVFFKLRQLTDGDGGVIDRPDTDTMTVFEGNYKEAEEMARTLLKDDPEARVVYGRLDNLAKVEAPPVKITKI